MRARWATHRRYQWNQCSQCSVDPTELQPSGEEPWRAVARLHFQDSKCVFVLAALRPLHRCGCLRACKRVSVREQTESLRPAAARGNGLRVAHAQRSIASTHSSVTARPCGEQVIRTIRSQPGYWTPQLVCAWHSYPCIWKLPETQLKPALIWWSWGMFYWRSLREHLYVHV